MKKILIADCDIDSIVNLKQVFEKFGYEVLLTSSGREILELASKESLEAIVMEVDLEGLDGLSVCKELRKKSKVPIIFLSGRKAYYQIIVGLDSGADDYVTKPFSPAEVMARIEAVFRRIAMEHKVTKSESMSELMVIDNLKISMKEFEVFINNTKINLAKREIETLFLMASNPNKVFTRDNLLDSLWGFDYYGDNRTVDTHIKRLRKKLSVEQHPNWKIGTVWGKGYKFEIGNNF
ncbi:MAG: response regulator transcription factor [Lachnospiraceae bacterium]|nr:response regulator transcription factor [Lachnospiraceae bacterium]